VDDVPASAAPHTRGVLRFELRLSSRFCSGSRDAKSSLHHGEQNWHGRSGGRLIEALELIGRG
jgi:hypothetical protein